MKRFVVGVVVMFALFASVGGCAKGLDQGLEPVANPTERHKFYGFSILPPSGDNWFIHPSGDNIFLPPRRNIPIFFAKRLDASMTGSGEFHKVVAMVTADHDYLPYYSREAVLEQLRLDIKQRWRPRPSGPDLLRPRGPVSFEGSEDNLFGAVCFRYTVTYEDRGVSFIRGNVRGFVNKMVTMSVRGFRCLHPYDPRLVIELSYSQRFTHGQWIEAFDVEVASFLESLMFTPVPLGMYVAKKLENYAALLREIKRDTEAKGIGTLAEKLRKVDRKETSTSLGFDPSAILNEYAAELRKAGREVEAKEAEALADRWSRNNLAAWKQLMRLKT